MCWPSHLYISSHGCLPQVLDSHLDYMCRFSHFCQHYCTNFLITFDSNYFFRVARLEFLISSLYFSFFCDVFLISFYYQTGPFCKPLAKNQYDLYNLNIPIFSSIPKDLSILFWISKFLSVFMLYFIALDCLILPLLHCFFVIHSTSLYLFCHCFNSKFGKSRNLLSNGYCTIDVIQYKNSWITPNFSSSWKPQVL